MPKRKFTQAFREQRAMSKRPRTVVRTRPLTVPRDRSLVPPRIIKTLRAVYSGSFTSASPEQAQFCVNSANNPFLTHSANQPRGFDQWAGLYQRCMVHSFKVVVRAVNTDTTDSAFVSMLISPGASPPDTDSRRIIEFPRSAGHIALPSQQNQIRMQVSGKSVQVYGVDDMEIADFAQTTSSTTVPSKTIYCKLYCGVVDGSGTNGLKYMVMIEQAIEFLDPASPIIS